MISGYRANNGLPAVALDPHLMEMAQAQAAAMAKRDKLDHNAGKPFVTRLKASGYDAKGFGLTMGLHSRIARSAETVEALARVGNLYVNRSMIGAIVGSQPFGGEGFSGTGPKAGGPHYLPRFCAERVTSTDTTSSGGNATLLSLDDIGF
jgi:hypothetical protein